MQIIRETILTRNRELTRSGIMFQVIYFLDSENSRFDFTSFATRLVNDSARLAIIDNPKKWGSALYSDACAYIEKYWSIDRSTFKKNLPFRRTKRQKGQFALFRLNFSNYICSIMGLSDKCATWFVEIGSQIRYL